MNGFGISQLIHVLRCLIYEQVNEECIKNTWEKLRFIKFYTTYTIDFYRAEYSIMESRRMRWAGNVERMGERRNAFRLLVGKPEGKTPLGRLRRRWVDNIRMDLGDVGWGDVDWIGLAQERNRWRAVVNSVLNLRVS
jgi:hypothetical protein